MKKNMLILSKYFFLIVMILLIIMIFYTKIRYAIFNGYIFERPISGQISISDPRVENKVVINDRNILVDGVYTEYEMVKRKWKIYDIKLRNEYGEIFFRAFNFSISDIKFHSNTDAITTNSSYSTSSSGEGESLIDDDEITSQAEFLVFAILVNTRYQLLYRQLKILACVLIPFICIGCLLYFKPVLLKRFWDEKSSYSTQLSEHRIRILGAGIFLISLLLPFILLYI